MESRVIFAHGLESSPGGTKATYLKESFGAFTPELFRLGLEEQIDALVSVLNETPKNILVGSSLGGLAALGAVQQCPERIAHLVLLAPAVGVHKRPDAFVEAEKTRPGLRKESEEISKLSVPTSVPTTIIHGIHDEVVDKYDVVELCARSTSSTLILVQDDHMLVKSKQRIISQVENVR